MLHPDKRTREVQAESNRAGLLFINTELELTLAFLEIARHSFREERRRRLATEAHKAYLTIVHALGHVSPTRKERARIDADLHRIESALEQLGLPVHRSGPDALRAAS